MTTQSKSIDRQAAWRSFLTSPFDWILISGLLGLLPLMVLESQVLSLKKHLQFFPIAWVGFVAIVYLRASLEAPLPKSRRVFGWVFLAASLCLASFAVLRFSPWVAHLSLMLLALGWLCLRAAGNRWTELIAWTSLFAITLPLPLNMDSLLIRKLQTISTKSASSLLDLTSTPFVARGNVLEVRTGELFVDEACSGVDSLYSLAAIALFLVVWNRSGLLSALVMLFLVPVWGWLGNLLRLFTIVFMLDRFGIDLSEGWPHTVLGMVVFAISFGCLMLSQQASKLLFDAFPFQTVTTTGLHKAYNWVVCWPGKSPMSRSSGSKRAANAIAPTNLAETASAAPPRQLVMALSLLFVSLGAFSMLPILAIGPWDSKRFTLPAWSTQQISEVFHQDVLPAELGELKRVDFKVLHRETGSVYGEHSATWTYQVNGQGVQISVDFPFPGFHPLEECYMASGKQLAIPVSTITTPKPDGSTQYELHDVLLHDELRQESFLCYLNFDTGGAPVSNVETIMLGAALAIPTVAYQVQVYLPDCGTLTEEQKAHYREVLTQVSPVLLERLRQLPGVR